MGFCAQRKKEGKEISKNQKEMSKTKQKRFRGKKTVHLKKRSGLKWGEREMSAVVGGGQDGGCRLDRETSPFSGTKYLVRRQLRKRGSSLGWEKKEGGGNLIGKCPHRTVGKINDVNSNGGARPVPLRRKTSPSNPIGESQEKKKKNRFKEIKRLTKGGKKEG